MVKPKRLISQTVSRVTSIELVNIHKYASVNMAFSF